MLQRDFWKKKRIQKITASLFLLAVFLLLSLLGTGGGEISVDDKNGVSQKAEGPVAEEEEGGEAGPIFVDVIGCVEHPGVYQLTAGSRVFQAIELAGGLTEDAEVRSINRAAVLTDEQVLIVLSKEEFEEQQEGAGGIGFVDGKVELNSADQAALESLSGIGPSMAQRIIEYRERNGKFKEIEELMNIDGIGEKTFQRLKSSICVQ